MVLTASILGFCLSVLLTLWPPTAWAEVPFYTITALGPQGVHAISSEGNVAVGWLGFRSGDHGAQEFSPTFHALGTLGGTNSEAHAATSTRIVGFATRSDNVYNHAFLYENGIMTDLEMRGTTRLFSAALALNADDVCGSIASFDATTAVPACWLNDVFVEYPTLGGSSGEVTTLNEKGNAAGYSLTPEGDWHCTYWPVEGGAVDCHSAVAGANSFARDMNSQNLIVGNTVTLSNVTGVPGVHRGFLVLPWGMVLLAPVADMERSRAYSINDLGLIVGESSSGDGGGCCEGLEQAATIWDTGAPIDLQTRLVNPDGWKLIRAWGISNDLLIAAEADRNGERHSVLLTPVDNAVVVWYKWKYLIERYYAQKYDRWRKIIAQYYYPRKPAR
jgi:probable HAF family extracellular repeat protein